jgi:hypothetical protein
MALGLSQLRPVFNRAAELQARFGLPVLGAVSKAMSAREVRQQRIGVLRFGAASGSLVLVFLVVLSVMSFTAGR